MIIHRSALATAHTRGNPNGDSGGGQHRDDQNGLDECVGHAQPATDSCKLACVRPLVTLRPIHASSSKSTRLAIRSPRTEQPQHDAELRSRLPQIDLSLL